MRAKSMWMIVVGVVALAAAAGLASKKLRAGDRAPAVGTAAPDFTLNSQEGKAISLHDFKGKWVVLYFYPKDMTSGCTVEAHNFQRDLAKYDAKNAVILGVSMHGVVRKVWTEVDVKKHSDAVLAALEELQKPTS